MEAPTAAKVIEEGAIIFFYYEITILSIFTLKQKDLPAVEL